MKKIDIYIDGACRGNPGKGGWGVVMRYGDIEKRFYGAEEMTTNNRMELTAAIEAIKRVKYPCEIHITTDSQYLRRGMTEWLSQWKKNNWRNAGKKPIKNIDLWQTLDSLVIDHQISWHWVRGHSGHEGNELADQLANQAIDEFLGK